MKVEFKIEGRFPSLNDYIEAERTNRYKAAQMKRNYQSVAAAAIRDQVRESFKNPVRIDYWFFESNRKRDFDNVFTFASKVIQDALVETGVLPNDSPRYVQGFSAEFLMARNEPMIVVEVSEVHPLAVEHLRNDEGKMPE